MDSAATSFPRRSKGLASPGRETERRIRALRKTWRTSSCDGILTGCIYFFEDSGMGGRCQGRPSPERRRMRRMLLFWLPVFLLAAASALSADVFRFAYTKGEKYRIVSQVHESVAVNGTFSHDADILNKIAVDSHRYAGRTRVTTMSPSRPRSGPTAPEHLRVERRVPVPVLARRPGGLHDRPFLFHARGARRAAVSRGGRAAGRHLGGEGQRGARLPGELRHRRSRSSFPSPPSYTYMGNETRDGIDCAVIAIDYEIFHKVTPPRGAAACIPRGLPGTRTRSTGGTWRARRPIFYQERFDFVFSFNIGRRSGVHSATRTDGSSRPQPPGPGTGAQGDPEADRHPAHPRRHRAAHRPGGDDHPGERELPPELGHPSPGGAGKASTASPRS